MDIHVKKKSNKNYVFFLTIDFINGYKYKESIRNKIKRWIFKEKNIVPPTIYEQRLGDVFFFIFQLFLLNIDKID